MSKEDLKNAKLMYNLHPMSTGREFGGRICCNQKTGSAQATLPVPGKWRFIASGDMNDSRLKGEGVDVDIFGTTKACRVQIGPDWDDVGWYHIHMTGSKTFSPNDMSVMWARGGWPAFLGTKSGDVYRSDPKFVPPPGYPNNWGDMNQIAPDGKETPVPFPPTGL
jgi:hypothetical protein